MDYYQAQAEGAPLPYGWVFLGWLTPRADILLEVFIKLNATCELIGENGGVFKLKEQELLKKILADNNITAEFEGYEATLTFKNGNKITFKAEGYAGTKLTVSAEVKQKIEFEV